VRDRIIQWIAALAGLGSIAAGLKVAWWLVARMLEGMVSGDLVTVIGAGLLMYLGGGTITVILVVAGIVLIGLALD